MKRHELVPIQYISPRAILTREQYRSPHRRKEAGQVLSIDDKPKFMVGGAPMTPCSNVD